MPDWIARATASTLILVLPVTAYGLLIDDFSEGAFSLTVPSPYNPVDGQVATGINALGGQRVLSSLAACCAVGGTATFEIDTDRSVFRTSSLSLSFPVTVKYYQFQYGSIDEPLSVDLTAGGMDRFRIRHRGDSPGLGLTVQVLGLVGGELRQFGGVFGSVFQVGPREAIIELPFDRMGGDPDALQEVVSLTFSTGRQIGDTEIDLIEMAPPPESGDFNRDGVVDLADLEFWQASYQGWRRTNTAGELFFDPDGAEITSVDATGDGQINAADYTAWRDAYHAAQQAVLVPEPSALLAAGSALLTAAGGRRRV